MPANSQQKQEKRDTEGRFVKGRSGDPAGRAAGTRNRATVLAEQLFDGATAALANKAVAMALDGDAVAMALDGDAVALRLCIGRIIAPRRHRPTSFALPLLHSAADLAPAMAAIAEAVADGTISTGEGWELSQVVDTFIRAIEAGAFEARLQRLEAVHGIAA